MNEPMLLAAPVAGVLAAANVLAAVPALLAARSHPRAASAQIFRDLKRTLGQLLRAE